MDHGKSTLADRMLERTGTIPERLMRDQVLDRMDLERERGITIKMQPVRMVWKDYVLNLIDTPGHIDFAYEVSRALSAVEGVLLLVDSTQGVEAQTLTTLEMAKAAGCVIIPVVSKIDAPAARVEEVSAELAQLLGVDAATVLPVSGRTGAGVDALLDAIVERVPPPKLAKSGFANSQNWQSPTLPAEARGVIFDFSYSIHRGITLYVRVTDGVFKKGQPLALRAADAGFTALEVGYFAPEERPAEALSAGEIGYIVTGIKEAGVAHVGDTVGEKGGRLPALSGFDRPRPVVWASVYPESQDDLPQLRQALARLRLSDSSLSFEEESSGVLGRGFRCGFLGLLHLEIVIERLKREAGLALVVTTPTISYIVSTTAGARETVYTPSKFPPYGSIQMIEEPWAKVVIIMPSSAMSPVVSLLYEHEAESEEVETLLDGRIELTAEMPLRELMRGFFDSLKNVSAGYASLSYELLENRPADVVRLDCLVAGEEVPAFAKIVARRRVEIEAEKLVEKLYATLPRQLFVTKIQAQALGRIIASKSLSALRKDVTGYLYGGDVSRKKKLLEKQKKGKKKLQEGAKVEIPADVFMKMVQDADR
ncbi:translation elongation factor 4 [Patescibacteria group bacterium]|nr:translation elongation factor 4 [Patescibacteria group bacterium]MDE1945279.1 translation elongation factor 4 [Patescibacteria group bacterium]